MLLVLVVMFREPECGVAQGISDQFWTLLSRWVKRMVGDQNNLEHILGLLQYFVDILPVMKSIQEPIMV